MLLGLTRALAADAGVVSGKVVEVNAALADAPETINEDAFGDGWLFVVELSDAAQADELLSPDDYQQLVDDEDH